jgi:hypothetical protein
MQFGVPKQHIMFSEFLIELIGADGQVERNVQGVEAALSASRFERLAQGELSPRPGLIRRTGLVVLSCCPPI